MSDDREAEELAQEEQEAEDTEPPRKARFREFCDAELIDELLDRGYEIRHGFQPTEFGGDRCVRCGRNIRSAIHQKGAS